MFFISNSQQPFWDGLRHACGAMLYVVFAGVLVYALEPFITGLPSVFLLLFYAMLAVVSFAILGILVFYAPVRSMYHHRFRTASVMMSSTVGWLLIFLIIFVLSFVGTSGI